MTIKQQGGIFGRNPTFNDVDVEGTLTSNTFTATSVTTENISTVNTDATSYASSSGSSIQPSGGVSSEIRNDSNGGFSWLKLRTTNSAAAIGYISYYNQGGGVVAGNMAFGGRTGSSAYTEQMSLNMANGNLSLNSGNLVIGTAGKGIDFSATGDITGVTSELLDSYEEGEFDVTLTPTTSGTITLGSSYNKGRYTFVGRLLTVTGFVIVDSVSSPVGNVRLSLPIAIGDGTEASGRIGGSVLYYNGSSDVVVGYNGVETNSYVQLFTNAASVASGHAVHFSITYMF